MLSGRVGEGLDDGCRLSINASDKMGNLCIAGGAKVDCTCSNSSVQCKSRDNLDGSYTFEWRSKMSGFFYVHVLVENQSIQGSPIKMRLSSSIPDLSKTVLTGSGIGKHIPAGVPVEIHLSFLDQYSNGCSPGSKHEYAFGITILPERSGAKLSTATAHRSEGKWSSEDRYDVELVWSSTATRIRRIPKGLTFTHRPISSISPKKRRPLTPTATRSRGSIGGRVKWSLGAQE
jgi:hypothetical protein